VIESDAMSEAMVQQQVRVKDVNSALQAAAARVVTSGEWSTLLAVGS